MVFRVVLNRADGIEFHGLLEEASSDGYWSVVEFESGSTRTMTYTVFSSISAGVEQELRDRLSASMPGRVLITKADF